MRFFRLLLPLLALGLIAGTSKPKLSIRFHLEANPNSGSSFTMQTVLPNSNRPVYLSKVCEISEKDVVAIFPFPADDGTQGCALKLDNHGRIALDLLSEQNHGATLVGFVNARLVTAMLIDRKVGDGIITIPRGLVPTEIEMMRKEYPTLGETGKKKKTPKAPRVPDANTGILPPLPVPTPLNPSAPRGD